MDKITHRRAIAILDAIYNKMKEAVKIIEAHEKEQLKKEAA